MVDRTLEKVRDCQDEDEHGDFEMRFGKRTLVDGLLSVRTGERLDWRGNWWRLESASEPDVLS